MLGALTAPPRKRRSLPTADPHPVRDILRRLIPHAFVQHATRIAGVVALCAIAGCATRAPAPVIERAPLTPPPAVVEAPPPATVTPPPAPVPTYTVKRGDTLRTIAQANGVDARSLVAWNNLANPDRLTVGQVLKLGPPPAGNALPEPGPTDATGPGVTTAPLRSVPPVGTAAGATPGTAPLPSTSAGPRTADNFKSGPKAIKLPYSPEAARDFGKLAQAAPATPAGAPSPGAAPAARPSPPPASSPPLGGDDDRLDWAWPAKGRVITTFSETANLKGIDIAGAAGTPIVASAAGKVVYAGTGLRGYGLLVIIKHNDTYLSAYAHNRAIMVKEGDTVARGQKIAEMGNTDADQVKLHFEIRRLGKPMDPMRFLPAP
jgi:lipoprotein NlpD